MLFARVLQRADHLQTIVGEAAAADANQFGVEKLDVELGVVNDDFGVFDELDQIVDDVAELWFVFEELAIDAVHRECAFVALALRIHILMEPALGNSPSDDFDCTDLDDAVAIADFEPRSLGVEYDKPRAHSAALSAVAGCAC